MRTLTALGLFLALAACGTPQERCVSEVSRDLSTLDRLIAQSQRNLERGFAVQTTTDFETTWEWCRRGPVRVDSQGRAVAPPMVMCERDRPVTRNQPVAIDLSVEKRKLDSMITKRKELERMTAEQIELCRARYPQS